MLMSVVQIHLSPPKHDQGSSLVFSELLFSLVQGQHCWVLIFCQRFAPSNGAPNLSVYDLNQ
jgi:hypothetical protein